jgi:hypothetical protein
MRLWLFNPFVYIAGARSLFIGLAAMLATAIIGFYSHTHFDGVIDIHSGHISPLYVHLLEQLIDWGMLSIVFYLGGRIFSQSSIRLIDVAGTIAMARWVMIVPAIIGFAIHAPDVMPKTIEEIKAIMTPGFIAFGFITLLFDIWMVTLFYSAFVTSCNMKGGKGTGIFIIGLMLAEFTASMIIHNFL